MRSSFSSQSVRKRTSGGGKANGRVHQGCAPRRDAADVARTHARRQLPQVGAATQDEEIAVEDAAVGGGCKMMSQRVQTRRACWRATIASEQGMCLTLPLEVPEETAKNGIRPGQERNGVPVHGFGPDLRLRGHGHRSELIGSDLGWGSVAVPLDDPGLVVGLLERNQGQAQLLDRVEASDPAGFPSARG